jgi:hypothetical protein
LLLAVMVAVAAACFTARARRWRIVGNDRREAVVHSVIATALGALVVREAGATAGFPILLLPAVFLGGFDFGNWQLGRSDAAMRSLATRSSRLSGSFPVIGGAYVGAAALMSNGHPLAAASEQLAVPWLYLMPAVTIFLSSWHGLARELTRVTRGTVSMEADEHLHDLIGAATRAIEDVRDSVETLGPASGVLERFDSAIQRSRSATDRAFLAHGYSVEAATSKPRPSFLTGVQLRSRQSSVKRGLRGLISNVKSWPMGIVTTLKRKAANVIAAWRALHNDQIEWVTLYATLWLRAALVIAAPALSGISYSPILPSSYRDWGGRMAIWWFAAIWCGLTALAAPIIVPWVEQHPSERPRRWLIRLEAPIAAALLVAVPAWPTAAFVAGPFNLLQRPGTLKRLLALAGGAAAAFGIGVVIHSSGWTTSGLVIEIVIAAGVLTVISCSYGLMAPLLLRATALLPIELWLHRRSERRKIQVFAVRQSGQAVADAERLASPFIAAFPENESLQISAERLMQARIRLEDPEAGSGESKNTMLDRLVLDSILRVVPQQGAEPEAHIHAFEPTVDPPAFGRARLTRGHQRSLRKAISQIAREAHEYGAGRLKTLISLDGERVAVMMANEVGSSRPKGRSRGKDFIRRTVCELPDGSLDGHGREPDTRLFGDKEAFVVRFSFSTSAFRRLPGRLG